MNDPGIARPGDKVSMLRGSRQGARGIIEDTTDGKATVRFSDGKEVVLLSALLNYSAAARKAWQTMPNRAVGRPKDPSIPRKKMVSLRLDSELWEQLGAAVRAGLLHSRESAINGWLREKLVEIGMPSGERGR